MDVEIWHSLLNTSGLDVVKPAIPKFSKFSDPTDKERPFMKSKFRVEHVNVP